MPTKFLIFAMMFFMIMSLISGMMEGYYYKGDVMSYMTIAATSFKWMESGNPLLGIAGFIFLPFAGVEAMYRMMVTDYSMFHGGWMIVRWVFVFPIVISIIWTVLLALRGTSAG